MKENDKTRSGEAHWTNECVQMDTFKLFLEKSDGDS